MAQQPIVIGAADAGGGDTLFAAFTKVQANFDELYSDDLSDVGSIIAGSAIAVDQATGDVTVSVADDGIDYAKLGAEFTTSAAVTTDLDFDTAQIFTKTMTGDTTFTYSNVKVGMIKDFILTGAFVPTFPAGTKTVTGTYDGSVSNLIQILAVANGDYWMSISKAQ